MGEQLMTIYNSLTVEAQKEAYDFIVYLSTKKINMKKKRKIDSNLFGTLHKYSNPSLIESEKEAWANAAAEKYKVQQYGN